MSSIDRLAAERLTRLARRDLARCRRVVEAWQGAEPIARVDGAERLVFCSNDYLGLARDPRVTDAFVQAAKRYGAGSGASHLISGHTREHHALEEELAAFTGRERALLYSTGYMANLGIVAALLGRGDRVLEDRLNHASLIDAALLARAELIRYPHGDAGVVDERLARAPRGRTLIATDGVFSMDGDSAPLADLAVSAQRREAWLMVDDAHGLGVVGASGRGSLEDARLDARSVPILLGTLGKAFGTMGAFVAGSRDLIELLLQTSRTYIYTTALPPAVAAATRTALAIAASADAERERLASHITLFRREVDGLGLTLADSRTPIQPIVLGSSARALAASETLWNRGLWVSAIRPPTVPEGTARLRVTLAANHTDSQVLRLVEALAAVARDLQ
jgi:8-amino-7-oxononanoate synthase